MKHRIILLALNWYKWCTETRMLCIFNQKCDPYVSAIESLDKKYEMRGGTTYICLYQKKCRVNERQTRNIFIDRNASLHQSEVHIYILAARNRITYSRQVIVRSTGKTKFSWRQKWWKTTVVNCSIEYAGIM